MSSHQFYLLGEPTSSARQLDLDQVLDLESLQHLVAAHFAIVEPKGMWCCVADFSVPLLPLDHT